MLDTAACSLWPAWGEVHGLLALLLMRGSCRWAYCMPGVEPVCTPPRNTLGCLYSALLLACFLESSAVVPRHAAEVKESMLLVRLRSDLLKDVLHDRRPFALLFIPCAGILKALLVASALHSLRIVLCMHERRYSVKQLKCCYTFLHIICW